MHNLAILALDDFVSVDLGIACEVFSHVMRQGAPVYRVRVCGERPRVQARSFSIDVPFRLDELAAADTVVVVGTNDPSKNVSGEVLAAIGTAWANGARIASICTGAFVLAAAGLLDGRRATTHWIAAGEFRKRFPKVDLDPDVLFVDEGRIITSAGAMAGMDMCLHLVARDNGYAAGADAARLAVAPLHRDGGQAQFIRYELPRSIDSLAPLLDWMLANLNRQLDVSTLAARVATSPRTFARRFRDQTGTTPLQWLLTARIRRAQELLETTCRSVDEVALAAGFEASVTFRTRFQQVVGLSPKAYRSRFRSTSSRPQQASADAPGRSSRD